MGKPRLVVVAVQGAPRDAHSLAALLLRCDSAGTYTCYTVTRGSSHPPSFAALPSTWGLLTNGIGSLEEVLILVLSKCSLFMV